MKKKGIHDFVTSVPLNQPATSAFQNVNTIKKNIPAEKVNAMIMPSPQQQTVSQTPQVTKGTFSAYSPEAAEELPSTH